MSLRGENLTAAFGGRAVFAGLSLELPPHSVTVLLGLNGAGKSTLLRVLAGLLPPTAGQVWLDGQSLAELSPKERARRLAYQPQQIRPQEMTVEEYVLLGSAPWLRWGAVPGVRWRQRGAKALARLGLEELSKRPMEELSGGERQRVALARTLLTGADLYLLDEPTASLDVKRQHGFFHLLRRLAGEEGASALVSVHDPNLALAYGDRVLVLGGGRLTLVEGGEAFSQRLWRALTPLYGPELSLGGEGFYWKHTGLP